MVIILLIESSYFNQEKSHVFQYVNLIFKEFILFCSSIRRTLYARHPRESIFFAFSRGFERINLDRQIAKKAV